MGLSKNTMIQTEDVEDAKSYPKYTWVGNRISKSDMARLFYLKQKIRTPITVLVSDAVKQFLDRQES